MIYSSKPGLVNKDGAHQPLNQRPILTLKKKLKLKKIKKRINKIFTKRFQRNKKIRKSKENYILKKLIINDDIKIQEKQKENENIIKDNENIENHDNDESINLLNKINNNLNNNRFCFFPNLIENTPINNNNNDNNFFEETFEEINSSISFFCPHRTSNYSLFEDYFPTIYNETNIFNYTNNNNNINYNNNINGVNINFDTRHHLRNNNREERIPLDDLFPFLNNIKLKDKEKIKSIKENLSRMKINKKIKLDDNKKNCCICLEDFKYGQNIYSLSCSHIFHVHCLNKEIKMRQKCPLCRKELNKKK